MPKEGFLIGFGLIAVIVSVSLSKPPAKPRETDASYIEAIAYSKKSAAHMYAAQYQWACVELKNKAEPCAMAAIGKAVKEKGTAFALEVDDAIKDTQNHMLVWMEKHPNNSIGHKFLPDYAGRVYNW